MMFRRWASCWRRWCRRNRTDIGLVMSRYDWFRQGSAWCSKVSHVKDFSVERERNRVDGFFSWWVSGVSERRPSGTHR